MLPSTIVILIGMRPQHNKTKQNKHKQPNIPEFPVGRSCTGWFSWNDAGRIDTELVKLTDEIL